VKDESIHHSPHLSLPMYTTTYSDVSKAWRPVIPPDLAASAISAGDHRLLTALASDGLLGVCIKGSVHFVAVWPTKVEVDIQSLQLASRRNFQSPPASTPATEIFENTAGANDG
jgi:hypothetical protein